jgi:imidazolonepropionase
MEKANILIKNAKEIVTCSGFKAKQGTEMSQLNIIENGAVVIENGIIKAVGKTWEVLKNYDEKNYEVIDASGKAVLPGFVDSHTHFVFGGYRAEEFSWRLRGDSYMDIMQRGGGIVNSVKATREASKNELKAIALKRLDSMLSFGVTTVEGKSGYGLDLDTEIKQLEAMKELDKIHPIDIVRTFLGAHATPVEYKGRTDDYVDYIICDIMPRIAKQNLAEFSDVFCEKNVFSIEQTRRIQNKAKEMGFKIKLHADEIVQFGGGELSAELGAISADHLLQVSDRGIEEMAKARVVATLLPCTAFSLKESFAKGRKMIDMGCAVALATDFNPGSCFCESIPLVFALATLQMNISIEEAITALCFP